MFAGNVMMMAGQEFRDFDVLRPESRETENSRNVINDYKKVGILRAVLAVAKPLEKEQWRQLGHPITHKIIMQHKSSFDVLPGDIFERAGRRFYNQTLPYNVGDLGHWTIFYCDERTDVV
jgi:hypothetical protein